MKIYYYKDIRGYYRFSTGVIRDDSKVGQYLRALRYAKMEVERLYPDVPKDFEAIKRIFKLPESTTWQEVFNPYEL